jgi:hypothetical protein
MKMPNANGIAAIIEPYPVVARAKAVATAVMANPTKNM